MVGKTCSRRLSYAIYHPMAIVEEDQGLVEYAHLVGTCSQCESSSSRSVGKPPVRSTLGDSDDSSSPIMALTESWTSQFPSGEF